jgi:dTDP-4-amino-4,6-dideoxygalactose transaminase
MLKNIARFGYRQAKNIVKLTLGKPLTYPSLGSMTLDQDDVDLARQMLKDKSSWNDAIIVNEYEKKFAAWNGSQYAFAFMGGRVALSACIYGLGLKPGDEVIIPGYTCVVVPNSFKFGGINVVYSDIELETFGLDASLLEEKINDKTKAIMLHHLYGLVCRDYEKIIDIAQKNNLKVIEDCAHSTGAKYNNKNVGNLGDVAFYSSEQSKVFTTIQGGMAVCNDDTIASRILEYYKNADVPNNERIKKQLYNMILNYYQFKHPRRWLYGDVYAFLYGKHRLISTTQQEECGIQPELYGMKMPGAIAAIGLNQLKKIDQYNEKRRSGAERWKKWATENGYQPAKVVENSIPVFLRYPVLVEEEKKKNLSWARKGLGVQPGVWFVSNIHPADWEVRNCPNADKAVRACINFQPLL